MKKPFASLPQNRFQPQFLPFWLLRLARYFAGRRGMLAATALGAILFLSASPAHAIGNILVNPSFDTNNSGNKVSFGWTYFLPPVHGNTHTNDFWIEGAVTPHSGPFYWKQWNAGYFAAPTNNVAGIYQEFGSYAGSIYQASGWFYTSASDTMGANSYVWIEVSFLDASSNILALYKSAPFSASVGTGSWFQYQVTNACDLSSPVSTGDPYFTTYAITGSVTQLVAPTGTATVRYRYAYLASAGDGGSCYFDDAALDQLSGLSAPIISDLFPVNMIFINPSDNLSFNVGSPSGSTINNNAIHLTLNGVDVSSSLAISGSTSNKTVTYAGLQSNTVYSASITVQDALGLSASASSYFQTTWVGIPPVLYLWEAEDFDFNGGAFIDNPDLCDSDGDPNCYFGQVGQPGIDEQNFDQSFSHLYRTNDEININTSGDYLRKNLFLANRPDYEINPFDPGDWVNYTRDWSNGTYWVVARVATDINLSGVLTLSIVNADSSTTDLGTFSVVQGNGWSSFLNIFLLDTNGNFVDVSLNGKMTLRVTSSVGNLLPTFFALVKATVDLPILSGMFPTGTHPFEYTNALSFHLLTKGATFPPGGITVNLDGYDVSSALVFTGSASNETVVYPDLLPNAVHTAIITATNSLGHGISVTNQFDTFNQANYTVEAEDFDFNGGQYISDSDYYPDAYDGDPSIAGIDFQHTTISGEQYPYRPNGIPQEIANDYLRQTFIDSLGTDYHLAWFGPGDWADYTRTYPTGKFNVYMRAAGLGSNSMTLQQVVSGAGASNQVPSTLGYWNAIGVNNQTHQWEELTDAGSEAPVAVSFGGVETLRLTTTTGDCYPSYFMFVPTAGVELSASRQGGNIMVSFPSLKGVVYRIFSRGDLSSGNWSLLSTVLSTGTVTTATVPLQGAAQFYKIVAP